MDLILFYDTETCGIPDYRSPSDAEHQPHLVEVAALVVDLATRDVVKAFHAIVRPDGWEIPDECIAVHGITNERAAAVGIPEALATELLLELWRPCVRRVAHNESFDARIVRIASKRHRPAEADPWKVGAAECTAVLTRPVLALPPTEAQAAKTSFKTKTPTLSEAHAYYFGDPLAYAHSAIADADACRRIYFAHLDQQRAAAA